MGVIDTVFICSTWKMKLTGLWCLVLRNPHKVRWYSMSIIILLLHKVCELQRICITCPRWLSWGANLKFQACMAAKFILITTIRVEVFLYYSRRKTSASLFLLETRGSKKGSTIMIPTSCRHPNTQNIIKINAYIIRIFPNQFLPWSLMKLYSVTCASRIS